MKNRIIVLAIIFILSLVNLYSQVGQGNSRSLLMSELQPINVTIGGDFLIEGTFPASPNERVDQFVTRIFNETRNQILSAVKDQQTFIKLYDETTQFAKRGIILKSFDGTEQIIDLVKFRLTGNFENNPYLKNDDVLIFPSIDIKRNFVDISGAVNKPTKFRFIEGDKLSDAILFAGGIDHSFENVANVEISRLSQDGLSENLLEVSINSDIELKVGDRIKVVGDPSMRKDYNVLVLGEVHKPGLVYIKKDSTTLYEVTQKAGGFKETAYLAHAHVIKDEFVNHKYWKDYLEEKFQKDPRQSGEQLLTHIDYIRNYERLAMLRMAYLMQEDSVNFFVDNELRIQQNRSRINFTNLDDPTTEDSRYIIQPNDVIIIPQRPDHIYIFGQVGSIGYYNYEEDKTYQEYIEEADGLSPYAEGEIFLIKSQSREWVNLIENGNAKIEPGDFLYVMKDIPRSFWYYAAQINTVASIVGSIATVVLLLYQFQN